MTWIGDFLDATKHIASPELFRKWGAIFSVGAALERKVWVRTNGSNLFPNLYIILCAPPAVGKTEVTWRVRDLLASVEEQHLAPTSVTKASLVDELADCEKKIVRPQDKQNVITYNSLTLCVNELGNFLPEYDKAMMNALTDLYDCKAYGEKRRTNKLEIEIENPQINMFTACTPSYLNSFLPEGAWDQGFTSRTIIVFTADKQLKDPFQDEDEEGDTKRFGALKKKLQKIGNMYGQMFFQEEVKILIKNWHFGGGVPTPDHPKLMYYNGRRLVHLLKLCMIYAAMDLRYEITVADFQQALDTLIEAEFFMPDIFKSMSSGGAGRNIEEAWHYLYTIYMKENKPIAEPRLVQFLQERIPVHQINTTIEMMERGQLIKKQLEKGGYVYRPLAKAVPK